MFKFSKLFAKFAKTTSSNVLAAEKAEAQNAVTGHIQIRTKYHQVKFYGAKNYWPQWSMMKNQTRRMIFKEYNPYRLRLKGLRKFVDLPPALKEIADHEMKTIPAATWRGEINNRCAVTSRGKGNVGRWHLSRFIFRHLADYNKLAGVQRGFWT